MARVQVRYFASLREAWAPEARRWSSRPARPWVRCATRLVARGGEHARLLARGRAVRCALDQVMAGRTLRCAGAEVAFFRRSPGG